MTGASRRLELRLRWQWAPLRRQSALQKILESPGAEDDLLARAARVAFVSTVAEHN